MLRSSAVELSEGEDIPETTHPVLDGNPMDRLLLDCLLDLCLPYEETPQIAA